MTGLDPIAIISKKKALEKQQAKSDLIIDPSKVMQSFYFILFYFLGVMICYDYQFPKI